MIFLNAFLFHRAKLFSSQPFLKPLSKILVQRILYISLLSLFLLASKPFMAVTEYQGSLFLFYISGFLDTPWGLVSVCTCSYWFLLSTQCITILFQHFQFLPISSSAPKLYYSVRTSQSPTTFFYTFAYCIGFINTPLLFVALLNYVEETMYIVIPRLGAKT